MNFQFLETKTPDQSFILSPYSVSKNVELYYFPLISFQKREKTAV